MAKFKVVLFNILILRSSSKISTTMKQHLTSTRNVWMSPLNPSRLKVKQMLTRVSVSARKKFLIYSMLWEIQKRLLKRPSKDSLEVQRKTLVRNSSECIRLLLYNSKTRTIMTRLYSSLKSVLMPLSGLKRRVKKLNATRRLVTFMRNQEILIEQLSSLINSCNYVKNKI